MRSFIACIHDVTPAYDREIRAMIADLEQLVGRKLSVGVVPNWHGAWPLAEHPEFCRFIRSTCDERLLHGFAHRRETGWGPVTLLTGGSDEMNGLDADETHKTLVRGQRTLAQAFGAPARGFLAPAWQMGRVSRANTAGAELDFILGFASLRSSAGPNIPLATFSWDCGRWDWLGHIGHATGRALHSLNGRVPVLAIHPNDLLRGYWPAIVDVAKEFLRDGYQPVTAAELLETKC